MTERREGNRQEPLVPPHDAKDKAEPNVPPTGDEGFRAVQLGNVITITCSNKETADDVMRWIAKRLNKQIFHLPLDAADS